MSDTTDFYLCVSDPFGHGLSYTQFEYSNLVLNTSSIHPCDVIGLNVTVANTGKVDGDEVIQVYAKQPDATVPVPRVRLVAFERVFVAAGSSATVELAVVPETHTAVLDNSFEEIYYGRDAVVVEKGGLQLFVGGWQPDFPASGGSVLSANATVTATATVVSCGL